MTYADDLIRKILTETRSIALVGLSSNPLRPSYFVGRYLALRGYVVIGVNPGIAGQVMFGQTVRARLSDITAEIDMVDIFRASDAVGPVVDEALARWPALKTIWMQIGVVNAQAAAQAQARGVQVVMDRCPKQEYQRLFGELRRAGLNTGIISSRLPAD